MEYKGLYIFFAVLFYLAFFGLIAWAIYLVDSATPLWALILTPALASTFEETFKK